MVLSPRQDHHQSHTKLSRAAAHPSRTCPGARSGSGGRAPATSAVRAFFFRRRPLLVRLARPLHRLLQAQLRVGGAEFGEVELPRGGGHAWLYITDRREKKKVVGSSALPRPRRPFLCFFLSRARKASSCARSPSLFFPPGATSLCAPFFLVSFSPSARRRFLATTAPCHAPLSDRAADDDRKTEEGESVQMHAMRWLHSGVRGREGLRRVHRLPGQAHPWRKWSAKTRLHKKAVHRARP